MAIAVLDIDGTLVDTNYQHALAWYRAFRASELTLPLWRIHRHIGMGGDQLVEALAGADVERHHGDAIRAQEKQHYEKMIGEVQALGCARDLLLDLRRRGHAVVLASSAKPEELEHYLDLLEAREIANAWTSSADVDATKPAPDLVQVALARAAARPEQAVMVGDSPWDARAAARAGVPTCAVMTGGFAREELLDAGASAVYESLDELLANLEDTPLR
jgi:HAD superfamily hydrolase (TIGR01509 family)